MFIRSASFAFSLSLSLLATVLIGCGDDGAAPGPPDSQTPDAAPPMDAAVTPDAVVSPCDPAPEEGHLYSMSAESFSSPMTSRHMCEYRGEALFIVNVAALCGYTPQYEQLQNLHETFGPAGVRVLGFISNDFGGQAGTKEELEACATMFDVTFEQFEQVGVRSDSEDGQHPIFTWLTSQEGHEGEVTWNFGKFLVGRDGELLARWDHTTTPDDAEIISAITSALSTE